MDENLHIEKFLKDSLQNYAVNPKLSSFDEIQARLQARSRRRSFWLFFSGLLLLSGGWWMISGLNETKIAENKTPGTEQGPLSSKAVDHNQEQQNKIVYEEQSDLNKPEKKKVNTPTKPLTGTQLSPPVKTSASAACAVPVQGPDRNNEVVSANNEDKVTGVSVLNSPNHIAKSNNGNEIKDNSPVVSSADKTPLQTAGNSENKNSELRETNETPKAAVIVKDSPVTGPDLSSESLPAISMFLPQETSAELKTDLLPQDNLIKSAEKPIRKGPGIVAGIFFNPQYGNFLLRDNPNGWDPPSQRKNTLDARRQEKNWYNYSFGLKAGLVFNSRWQVLLGYGVQRYRYNEARPVIVYASQNTISPSMAGTSNTFAFNSADAANTGYYKDLRYYTYSLDVCRFANLGRFMRVKVGMDMQYDRYRYASLLSSSATVNRHFFGFSLKAGLVEDIGSRLQLQVSPNIFCAASNMLNNTSQVEQRPYSLGVEAMLVFRIIDLGN